MNVFFLDLNPVKCAKLHINKHVNKMILESAQILSIAVHKHSKEKVEGIYKNTKTWANHPCAIWVRQTRANFDYVLQLALLLCNERKVRKIGNYNVEHSTKQVLLNLKKLRHLIPEGELTNPALAINSNIKETFFDGTLESVILCYRVYYCVDKINLWNDEDKSDRRALLEDTLQRMPIP